MGRYCSRGWVCSSDNFSFLGELESGSSVESSDQGGMVEGLRGGKREWNSLEDWVGEQTEEM